MIMTQENELKLNLTEAAQKEYDAYPPPWKQIIDRVVEWKEDGHEIIVDVINNSQSEDWHVRDEAYGYLNDFFAHYIATYDYLKDDSVITSIYKTDLMRWRGGQLSLNAICPGIRNLSYLDSSDYITFLPSDKFLFSPGEIKNPGDLRAAIKDRWVMHLKGDAKLRYALRF